MKGLLKKSAVGLLLVSAFVYTQACMTNTQLRKQEDLRVLADPKDVYVDLDELARYKKSVQKDLEEVNVKSKKPTINYEDIKEL